MADLNFTVDVRTQQAQANLKRLVDTTKATSDSFKTLNTVIAGIAIGGLIRNSLLYADAISELGSATGLGTQFVKGFSEALVASGGSFEAASVGLGRFSQSISDAISGQDTVIGKFQQLGITLQDLANLSDRDILRLTIERLAKMPEGATRTALAMDLLGKKFATVDFRTLNAGLDDFVAKSKESADAIDENARLQDNLEKAYATLQTTVLKAIQPIANFINNLKPEQIERFVEAVVKIGAAATSIAALAKVFSYVGSALAVLGTLWLTFQKGLKITADTIKIASGRFNSFITALYAANNYLSRFAEVFKFVRIAATKTIPWITKGFALMAGPIGVAIALLWTLNDVISLIFGVDILKNLWEGVGKLYDKTKQWLGLGKNNTAAKALEDQKKAADEAAKKLAEKAAIEKKQLLLRQQAGEADVKTATKLAEGLAKEQASLDKRLASYRDANDEQLKGLQNQIEMTGMTEREKAVREAMLQTQSKYTDEIRALKDRELELNNEIADSERKIGEEKKIAGIWGRDVNKETIRGLQDQVAVAKGQLPLVQEAIRKTTEEYQKKADTIKKTSGEAYDAIMREREANQMLRWSIDQVNQANASVRDIQREMAQLTMTEIEKKYSDIQYAAERSAQAQIDAINQERKIRGESLLSLQEEEKIRAEAVKSTGKIIDAQGQLYNKSREFSTGWKRAFNDYVENATNAAKRAENIFKTATQGMEEAIVNFAKTGKFEWRNFVSMMMEELLRSQIQQLFGRMLGGIQGQMRNASSSFMPGESGGMPTGGGILGGILDFFGGFFANGGTLGAGKWGIAGENGPELIRGPASVTPMGGGMSSVVYNINAVDAASFKQLVARDPSFIHAVALQGAKSYPGSRR